MGVPTSEVGYTIATARRENHEVHKNRWWHWRKKKKTVHGTERERNEMKIRLSMSPKSVARNCLVIIHSIEVGEAMLTKVL